MPLPGGPSDKIGNRYERRWTTYCMIKVMLGRYDSIYLEPLDEGKAEFFLKQGEKKLFHQAKRQLTKGNWTLSKLDNEGILDRLAQCLNEPDIHWVFISGHPAQELRELSERAKSANSWLIFSDSFLDSQKAAKDFDDLKRYWQSSGNEETFEALQRIEVITIDETMLRELNLALLQQFFDSIVAENVISALKEYAEDSIHIELTTQNIWDYLTGRGYEPEIPVQEVIYTAAIPITPAMSIIEQSLHRDIQMLSDRLSQEIDTKLKSIDQIRKEGRTEGLIEQLEEIKSDHYGWLSLTPEQKAEVLCIEAALTIDVENDIETAKQLTQEAESLAQIARVARMKAQIIIYRKGDRKEVLSLVEDAQDIDSINLHAAILVDREHVQDAQLLLENLPEPNAETFRILAVIYIKEKDLAAARTNIQAAIALEPDWQSIKFIEGVITFLSSLSTVVLDDIFNLWPWPHPIQHSLVTLDHQSLQLTRSAHEIFEELISRSPRSKIIPLHLWNLACLIFDPEFEQAALGYCSYLLDLDASHIPTIMWAMLLNLDVATEQMIVNLQNTVQGDEATPQHKLVLADLYHRTGEYSQLSPFLEEIKTEFDQSELRSNWYYHYVRMLLANDEYDNANEIFREIEFENDDAKFMLETLLFEYGTRQTGDFAPLIEHLKNRYDETQSAVDLLSYCQLLYQTRTWETLLENLGELLEQIDTNDVFWLAIQANFETDNYQRCLDILDNYLDRFIPLVPMNHLLDIRAACLQELGQINDAIEIMEDIVRREPTEHHFHNLAHLYYTTGNTAKLEILAQQLLTQSVHYPNGLMDLADLLQNRNPEVAIRLMSQALIQEIPDDRVGGAWILVGQLGLHPEAEKLFERLMSLGAQGQGGNQAITPSDLLNLRREGYRKAIDARTEYLKGTDPIHLYADDLKIPLITQYFFNFQASNDDVYFHRQTAIYARHGGRPIIHPHTPEEVTAIELYADLTAILVAANLGANLVFLDLIEETFSPIYIPQQLIPALEEMGRALNINHPEIVAAKKQVLGLINDGSISVIDTSHVTIPEETGSLRKELRDSQIALLHLAKSENGYYVDFLPVHKMTETAELQVAEIPDPWAGFLINRQSVAESLRLLGKITAREFQAATSKLVDVEIQTPEITYLSQNINLYFDYNAIETIALADILLATCRNFQVFVAQHYETHLRNELKWHEHSAEMTSWLHQLIQRLNQGIQRGNYRFVRNPPQSRLVKFGQNARCLLSSLEIPQGKVIWIDDRFSNSAPFENAPTIGTNDILRALLAIDKIDLDEYYDYVIKLRAANFRYIPLEIDELLYHLRQAIVQDRFIETPELKTIKRYIASCMEYPNDLQHPVDLPSNALNKQGEIAFIGSLKLNIYNVFSRIWIEIDKSEHKWALADWVVNNLFLDYMALIEDYHGQLGDFRNHRLVPDLAALALQFWRITIEEEIEAGDALDLLVDFSDWMWSRILEPHIIINPGLLSQVIDRVKLLLGTAREIAQQTYDEEPLQHLVLYQIYLNLPEDIRQELNQDEDFLRSIGIEVISIIEVNGIQFDAREFWRSVSEALGGASILIDSLNFEEAIQLNLEEQENRKVISFAHPSNNTPGSIQIRHTGILSDVVDDQADNLTNKRYWLDCSDEEFAQLKHEIINTTEPYERVNLVDQFLDTSVTLRYSNLLDQLKNIQPGDHVNLNDLLPPSLDGLRRHLRLPKQANDFAEAYAIASSVLLDEGDLAATIQRLACLPIPLPETVIDRFKQLEKSKQDEVFKIFELNRSPTAATHLLTLRALAEDHDVVERLITFLLSETNYAFTIAFRQVLNWTLIAFEALPDFNEFPDSFKLALCWVYAHYLFSIWVSLGRTPEEIAKFFATPPYSPANPLENMHNAYYFDIANPARFDPIRFTLWGIAYAANHSKSISFSSENQTALAKIMLISDENNTSLHPTLHQNFDQANNLLSSFLDFEVADMINDYLPEGLVCPNQIERRDLTQTSLSDLIQDVFSLQGWRRLGRQLGGWPIHEEFRDDLQRLFLAIDIVDLYREQLELGHLATQCMFLQLAHLQSPEVWEKSNQAVLNLAGFFAEQEVALRNTHDEEQFDALILESLFGSILVVSSLSLNRHIQLVELVSEISDIWPAFMSIIRPNIEGLYSRAQAQDCKEYWPLLMKLRARNVE